MNGFSQYFLCPVTLFSITHLNYFDNLVAMGSTKLLKEYLPW